MTEAQAPSINARPRIELNNGSASTNMNDALLDMVVTQPLSGMARAEIRFVNWRSNDADGNADFAFQSIEHGAEISVLAGESDAEPLFTGEITALEERYGKGAPQLVILAEDKLHHLARARQSRRFEDMSLNDVLQSLVGELGLQPDISVSDYSTTWLQLNESNLAFIQRLIGPYDLAMRVDNGRVHIKAEEADAEPVKLEAQNNVKQVRIMADLHHQNTGTQVKGFDLSADDASEASFNSPPGSSGESAKDILSSLSWGQEETVALPFARAQAEADGWAEGRFTPSSKTLFVWRYCLFRRAGIKSGARDRLNRCIRPAQRCLPSGELHAFV